MLKLMCGSIAHAFDDANQKIAENTDRICRLEHRQSMDDWYHKTIDSCRNLSNRDKLLEATFSFYKSTGGDWDNSAMHRFRNAMRDVGLEEYRISPVELFAGDSDRFLSPHIEPSCVLPVAPEKENRFPTLKCMQIALEKSRFFDGRNQKEMRRIIGSRLLLSPSCRGCRPGTAAFVEKQRQKQAANRLACSQGPVLFRPRQGGSNLRTAGFRRENKERRALFERTDCEL